MVFYTTFEPTPFYFWLAALAWMTFFGFATMPIMAGLGKLKKGDRRQQRLSRWLTAAYLFAFVGIGIGLTFWGVHGSRL